MADRVLIAKRINNGQSEIWLDTAPKSRRVVATNAIVYPVRTLCSAEESGAFHNNLAAGEAAVPQTVVNKLVADLKL